jgi:hypothetical protein
MAAFAFQTRGTSPTRAAADVFPAVTAVKVRSFSSVARSGGRAGVRAQPDGRAPVDEIMGLVTEFLMSSRGKP